ncbi:hypothetical protein BXY85_3222 [Roseivirga pacifica]|uniref:AsmA-like C-terminal region n=1 Tax=Roseivirga pacifica TaxID=1267423 RepID=A0A1I0QS84_9BACT|nr:hypothetical protein [Roseivirga pacifica]RKQ42611.1 hypothetical protein BXY85_3222 [Roseivirga pacifica]SEW30459.1 hypothetical protein SAMN05216290_2653 [Roseivirga pacifica]
MNKKLRALLITLLSIFIGGFLFVTFFLEGIMRKQLSAKLDDTFQQYYQISFEDSRNGLNGLKLNIKLLGVKFTTDTVENPLAAQLPAMFFDTDEFDILGIHMMDLLFRSKLSIDQIGLKNPQLLMVAPERGTLSLKAPQKGDSNIKDLLKSLTFKEVMIEGGSGALVYGNNTLDTLYGGDNLSLKGQSLTLDLEKTGAVKDYMSIDGLVMSLENALFIPRFSPYRFAMNSSEMDLKEGKLTNAGVKALPKRNLYQASVNQDFRKTIFNISIDTIDITGLHFKSLLHENTIKAKNIALIQPDITLFQNMNIPRNEQKEKPVFGELITKIPHHLDIDSVLIAHMNLKYEVLAKEQTQPATVYFENVNGYFANFRKNENVADTIYSLLEGKFMGEGDLSLSVDFPLSAPETQTYSGHISAMSFESFNPIFASMGKINLKDGKINNIYFTGKCDKYHNTGQMIFDYQDLKVEFKNKHDKTKWLKSGIANLLVKNNSHDEKSGDRYSVNYHYTRPLYIGELGFLVRGLTDGVAQVVMPKAMYNIYKKN